MATFCGWLLQKEMLWTNKHRSSFKFQIRTKRKPTPYSSPGRVCGPCTERLGRVQGFDFTSLVQSSLNLISCAESRKWDQDASLKALHCAHRCFHLWLIRPLLLYMMSPICFDKCSCDILRILGNYLQDEGIGLHLGYCFFGGGVFTCYLLSPLI